MNAVREGGGHLPDILRKHVEGRRALDFGCGTGRSTRLLRSLGFDATGVDIAGSMIAQARTIDADGDYRHFNAGVAATSTLLELYEGCCPCIRTA